MTIKEFWKNNKMSFIYSSIAFIFGSMFIIARQHAPFNETFPITLLGILLMFLLAYGIYEFTGGDK